MLLLFRFCKLQTAEQKDNNLPFCNSSISCDFFSGCLLSFHVHSAFVVVLKCTALLTVHVLILKMVDWETTGI